MSDFIKTKGWNGNIYSANELYHSAGYDRCLDIFQNNMISGLWFHKIHDNNSIKGTCFTRNKALSYILASRSPIQFIVDYQKIKNHNRIIPINAEYQLKKDTDYDNFINHLKSKGYAKGYASYCSRSNSRNTPWDEEFVCNDIKELNKVLKGIVFVNGERGSYLSSYQKRHLYSLAREYAKKYNIPFAVEKSYLREMQEQIVNNIWDNLEEEDNDIVTYPKI